jgi:ribosomal RNA assembly protein
MIDFIKIPEESLKIFKQKEYKDQLEKLTGSKIGVDEEVSIESKDPLMLLRVKEAVKAFGRGFDFDTALNLLDEEYYLETMNIQDFCGKSKSRMAVLKGRLIGSEGKTKRLIEKCTNVKIAIYGKTVSIIGKWDDVERAKQAVEGLLYGRKHSTVYRSLMEGR